MKIASLIFLILFGLSSLVHLYFCFIEDERKRVFSKPFCLSFLTIAIILYTPKNPLIYLGAFFGLLGDIFLVIKNKKKGFIIGTAFFFIGHILYLVQAILLLSYNPPWYAYLIAVISALLVATIIFIILKKHMDIKLAGFGSIYLSILVTCITVGVFLIVDKAGVNLVAPILFTVGYCLFLSSDSMIAISRFIKNMKRSHFYIMATYLIAQLLITLGFCLLL